MIIFFTRHAENKFEVLRRHGLSISKDKVMKTIQNPDLIDKSRLPLLIAQSKFDRTHVLRVVYKYEQGIIKVITFYPGRLTQYGKK